MPDAKDGSGPDPRYRTQKEASDEFGALMRRCTPMPAAKTAPKPDGDAER